MEKTSAAQVKVSHLFDRLCQDILPDLDVHEALSPLLKNYAIDELLEGLREHCVRMSGEPGDSWQQVADGLKEVLGDF